MPQIQELSAPRLNRRNMLKATAGAAGLLLTGGIAREAFAHFNAQRPPILGFTFSTWECDQLGLDPVSTLKELAKLEPNVVRFGSYWDKIEPRKGLFNFKDIDDQLNEVSRNPLYKKTQVILTVGMKAPRYPEFFFPLWIKTHPEIDTRRTNAPLDSSSELAERATNFVLKTLEFAKDFPQIAYRQYENEPFNPNGVSKKRYLSPSYIQNLIAEGEKVSGEDSGKTLLTYALSPMFYATTRTLVETSRLAQSAGKNLYTDAPGYLPGADMSVIENAGLQRMYLNFMGIEDWVTECQAEPWEKDGIFPLRTEYASASPESAYNLARLLGGRGHQRVIEWGAEFWEKQRQMGNPDWMRKMYQLFSGR